MHQAVARSEEVHEGAEIHDLDDLAFVDFADFGFRHDRLDPLQRRLDGFSVGARHLDGAVVLDVDLGASLLDDLADHLAARSDDFADLVGGYLDGLDTRRMLSEFGTCAADRLSHLAENMDAPSFRLIERNAHDLFGNPGDLDLHWQRGHTNVGPRHFEIHVAEMIFIAQDIREHGESLPFQDEPHGDAC